MTDDDVRDELCDTIKDDVKDQTEANVYEPFEEFVKQVGEELKSAFDQHDMLVRLKQL